MSGWITLSPDAFIHSHRQQPNDGELFFRSPFDVPEAIRIEFDPQRRTAAIHLRYIGGDEPTERIALTTRVSADVGKRSRRFFGIYLPGGTPQELGAAVGEAAAEIRSRANALAAENSDATVEAIESTRPRLFSDLQFAAAY
jgi:hypothetical protein